MKLFAGCVWSRKDNEWNMCPLAVWAETRENAVAMATKKGRDDLFPISDGWRYHSVGLVEVPKEVWVNELNNS